MSDRIPAPALLGSYDDGDWVALVFEDVDGHHPQTPWDTAELHAVLAALRRLASTPLPVGQRTYPQAREVFTHNFAGWHRLAVDPPPDLDPWARAHLDELAGWADRVRPRLTGDSLCHLDVRADNLLIRPDGEAVIVDWPWAARGPRWLDTLLLLVNVNLSGGHDVEALVAAHVTARSDVARSDVARSDVARSDAARSDAARPGDVTGFLVGLTGYFLDAARRPVSPGLPTVRSFQAAEGRSTLDWVRRRLSG